MSNILKLGAHQVYIERATDSTTYLPNNTLPALVFFVSFGFLVHCIMTEMFARDVINRKTNCRTLDMCIGQEMVNYIVPKLSLKFSLSKIQSAIQSCHIDYSSTLFYTGDF